MCFHLTDDKISSYIKRPYLQIQYLIGYNWSSSHKSWLPGVVRVFSRDFFFQWTATLIHVVKWLGFSLIYIFCQTVYKLNIGVFTLKKKNSVMWNSQKLINLDNCSKIHYSVDLRVPVFCRGQDCLLHFLICSRLTQGINQGISNKWSRYCFLRTKVLT